MKKSVFALLVLIILCINQIVSGQVMPDTYTTRYYDTLRYGLFVPENYDPNEKYPLITYLHGYDDTLTKYFDWYRDEVQSVNPCFVISPRCTRDAGSWGSTMDASLTPHIQLTLELIDSLINEFSIDTSRLYIYGYSMGGIGTLNVLYRQPARFAAAMVLCGGGNTEAWEEVSQTPVWFSHGTDDESVPYEFSRSLYDTMVARGAKRVRYKTYPGVGHNMWDYAPDEGAWIDWMFHFTKDDALFEESPDIPIQVSCEQLPNTERFMIRWTDADNRDEERKNKIWYYKVIRNGEEITTRDYSDTSYVDVNIADGVNTYQIVAINYDFNESDTSNAYSIELSEEVNTNELSGNTLVIYPIPAEGFIHIKSEIAIDYVEIIDIYGRIIMIVQGNNQENLTINTEEFKKGLHFIRLYNNDKSVITKRVIF